MKHSFILLWTLLISFVSMAQISYEEGYFIDNNDKIVTCLIRNMDWRGNPESFEYKLNAEEQTKSIGVLQIKEFGIGEHYKFLRSTIMIDRSSDLTSELSNQRTPEFVKETVFLKVLIEGAARLYQYEGGNIRRFFFSKKEDEFEIKPLIFKRFRRAGNTGTNYQFRQQLTNEFKCLGLTKTRIDRMEYKTDDLIHFFGDYNNCVGGEQITYKRKGTKSRIRLTPHIGANSANFSIQQSSLNPFPISRNINVEFGGKFYPSFGLQFEIALPFGGNKWRVFLDPTYMNYKNKQDFILNINSNDLKSSLEVNYTTIEIPIGMRHYFVVNENSQLFLNASFAFVFNITSELDFEVEGPIGQIPDPILNGTEEYFSAGLGYLMNNKWSLEARFNTGRDLLGDTREWTSNFDSSFSIIFGYNLL